MARTVNQWLDLANSRQPRGPKAPGWLENLRRALARQRQLEEEALRLQIRRRPRP